MSRIERIYGRGTHLVRAALLFVALVIPLTASAQTLRVATYNLYNYLSMDRSVDGQWRKDYPKPEIEKSALRRAILEVQPDVLAIQEIGSPDYLRELLNDLRADGLEYPHFVHLQGPDPDRCLAILRRLPLYKVIRHTDLDFKYFNDRETVRRGMLEVEIRPRPGLSVQIFTLHLKSRWTLRDDDPEAVLQRTREAEACRNRIVARTINRGSPYYLILGDFNDDPDSAPLRRFQKRGKLPISERLLATDSRSELWTHFYRRQSSYSTVDGILAAPQLMPAVKTARIADLIHPPEGSDHRLVYTDFDFTKLPR
ncbi:MAG: hypothetical protein GWO81_00575 [Verrucomicrobia bacterium]|nr:hypothetical protein [Verrucomicrobiota bacterium]